MANKKKQVKNLRWKASYLWILPLIAMIPAVLPFGLISLPAGLWILAALCAVSVVRGDQSVLLSLALLYMIIAAISDVLLGVSIGFWNIYGDAQLSDLLWPFIIFNIPMLLMLVAYIRYRRIFGWEIPGQQRLLARVFDVLLVAFAAFSLCVAFGGQIYVGEGPLLALVASFFVALATIYKSRISIFIAFCLFGFAIGLTFVHAIDIMNYEANSVLVALCAIWNSAVILLTFAVTRLLFSGRGLGVRASQPKIPAPVDRLTSTLLITVCTVPILCYAYFYLFGWDISGGGTLRGAYVLLAPWVLLDEVCLVLYYTRRYWVRKRIKNEARFETQQLTFWALGILVLGAYWSLMTYNSDAFPDPFFVLLITSIAPLGVAVFPRISRAGSSIFMVTALTALICNMYSIFGTVNPLEANLWTLTSVPGLLGCSISMFALIVLWKRARI